MKIRIGLYVATLLAIAGVLAIAYTSIPASAAQNTYQARDISGGGYDYRCNNDTDCADNTFCNAGDGIPFCVNRICRCPESADPGYCPDSCSDMPFCPFGSNDCGGHEVSVQGNTVFVLDCRGIQTGQFGGVLSYCDQAACSPEQNDSCQSCNACGACNSGTIQCDGSCGAPTPPASACGSPPIGAFDALDCNAAWGWSFDADYAGFNSVQIYRDGPAGTGTLVATVPANQSRPDIGAAYPGRTNSGWNWGIPASLKDGSSHTLYTYAVNLDTAGVSQNPYPQLTGSPRSLLCANPPTGTLTSATCGTATGNATDSQGSPVAVQLYDGIAGAGGVLIGTGSAGPNFSISFPAFTDGLNHSLYAYGQDIPTGTWYQLSGTVAVACPPSLTLSATPPAVAFNGTSTITWSSVNATTCTASAGSTGWAGTRPANGSFLTGALTTTTTFTLACTGAGGTDTKSTVVTVAAPPPPVVTLIGADQPDYCVTGDPQVTARWQYSSPAGLGQSQWQLQVSRNAGFTSIAYDSGIKSGSIPSGGTGSGGTTGQGVLTFGRIYWMRVQAWDSLNTPSAWSGSMTFATPAGPYPLVSFSVTPATPAAQQPVTFTDTSNYAGAAPVMRQWDFGDGTITTETPGTGTTIHTYTSATTGITATLRASSTSTGGQTCAATTNFSVNKPIPIYKEVRPGAVPSQQP